METHTTSHGLSLKKRVTLLTSFLILLLPMVVVADVCTYEKAVSFTVPVDAVQRLSIRAETGALAVHALPAQDGRQDGGQQDEIRVEARVCSARKAALDDMDVVHTLNGDVLLVQAVIPEIDSAFWINHYPYIDMDFGIPAGLAVTIKDGSGDIQVSGTGALRIDDGSGELRIAQVGGTVSISDGSGSIDVMDVEQAVTILEDGSGSTEYRNITGDIFLP